MRGRHRYFGHTGPLDEWFDERSQNWWKTHRWAPWLQAWILTLLISLVSPFSILVARSPSWVDFFGRLHLEMEANFLVIAVYEATALALPFWAAISLFSFMKPLPHMLITLGPVHVWPRLVAAARQLAFTWTGIACLVPFFVGSQIVGLLPEPDFLDLLIYAPKSLAILFTNILFVQELAVALLLLPLPARAQDWVFPHPARTKYWLCIASVPVWLLLSSAFLGLGVPPLIRAARNPGEPHLQLCAARCLFRPLLSLTAGVAALLHQQPVRPLAPQDLAHSARQLKPARMKVMPDTS